MSGRAVRLEMVSRLSLSSSSTSVPSGLCKCGGTTGVEVAVVCTAKEAGRFGEGTPAATLPLRSNTGAEWMEKREPSCAAGWLFIFSSMIALPEIAISWDAAIAISGSARTFLERHASWKLHSLGSDMFPQRLPRRYLRGDRNTLDCVAWWVARGLVAWFCCGRPTTLGLAFFFFLIVSPHPAGFYLRLLSSTGEPICLHLSNSVSSWCSSALLTVTTEQLLLFSFFQLLWLRAPRWGDSWCLSDSDSER